MDFASVSMRSHPIPYWEIYTSLLTFITMEKMWDYVCKQGALSNHQLSIEQVAVFWVVTPHSDVVGYQHFR